MPPAKPKASSISSKKQRTPVGSPQTTTPTVATPHGVPRWPHITSKPTLTLVPVLDSQIYLLPTFFTSKECDSLIAHIERHIPLTQVPTIPKKGEAFRSNDRTSFTDPALALMLWDLGLGAACTTGALTGTNGSPCGLNSNIRVYRYTPGQRFEPHYDDSVRDTVTGLMSEWTLLVYLTGSGEDGLEGGETVFYTGTGRKKEKNAVVVKPERGWVLRSDVMSSMTIWRDWVSSDGLGR
ncbi:hypothetical protein BC936DRAFT_141430, partial [Jimgerdemannia flammicorona]